MIFMLWVLQRMNVSKDMQDLPVHVCSIKALSIHKSKIKMFSEKLYTLEEKKNNQRKKGREKKGKTHTHTHTNV